MNVPLYAEGLPESIWQIAAWQYDEIALKAVVALLKKE